MSYAIVGFGHIGQALAKAFARSNIEVSVATTHDPERFASAAAAIGPTIIPTTPTEAVKAEILFLAVSFEAHQGVAKALSTWQGPQASGRWLRELSHLEDQRSFSGLGAFITHHLASVEEAGRLFHSAIRSLGRCDFPSPIQHHGGAAIIRNGSVLRPLTRSDFFRILWSRQRAPALMQKVVGFNDQLFKHSLKLY